MSTPADPNVSHIRRINRKLTILLRTGMLLMESAADTNRIVRNMRRVAAFLGLEEEHLHIDVLYGTIKVNYSNAEHSFSRFVRSDRYTINMRALAAISRLSWRSIEQDYTPRHFERALGRIATAPSEYPAWMVALGAALGCGAFCVLFGGDWPSFIPAMLAALLGFVVRAALLKSNFNVYMVTALAAFLSTLTAWGLMQVLPEGFTAKPYHPFLSCALYLMPGVALINFLDDMLDNYLLVGLARMANALMQMASMTFGIVVAVSLFGDMDHISALSTTPAISYGEAAVVTAIAAMGFGMIFNVPRRTLPVVALLGVMGMFVRNFTAFSWSQGVVLGSLLGASLISLLAIRLVTPTRSPNHVLSIPSVIPMSPGILIYKGIMGFLHMNNEMEDFFYAWDFLVSAALILLCLSVGVAIPNIFARRWVASARKRELRRLIEERRRRGHVLRLSDLE